MSPRKRGKAAGASRYIPGIFNYCDRWCERCLLSHRCLNYAMEKAEDKRKPGSRQNKQKLWDDLQAKLQATLKMVEDELKRRGFDSNALKVELQAAEEAREARHQEADRHPLARAAEEYASAIQRWFKNSASLFQAKHEELAKQVQLEIGRPREEAKEIREWMDTIHWYYGFIHVKLVRALEWTPEDDVPERSPDLRWLNRDGDGSAKIALIAIDRSLAAWTALRECFPEQEDAILDFQVQLARIRREAEKRFPNARAFVRPGFDEEAGRLAAQG